MSFKIENKDHTVIIPARVEIIDRKRNWIQQQEQQRKQKLKDQSQQQQQQAQQPKQVGLPMIGLKIKL